jgi:hypothetical protein
MIYNGELKEVTRKYFMFLGVFLFNASNFLLCLALCFFTSIVYIPAIFFLFLTLLSFGVVVAMNVLHFSNDKPTYDEWLEKQVHDLESELSNADALIFTAIQRSKKVELHAVCEAYQHVRIHTEKDIYTRSRGGHDIHYCGHCLKQFSFTQKEKEHLHLF